MEYKHAHPINILENTSRFFLLLLFPVLRGLLLSGAGFAAWLAGAWFDLMIIAGIVGLGFVSWYFYTYRAGEDGIYVHKGILLKQVRFIPYARLATVTLEKPFYLAPFRAVRLKADTDAGNAAISDFSITMRRNDALALIAKSQVPFQQHNAGLRRVYHPRGLYVAILSLLTSNTLTGVLFFSAFISQSGNLLGQEFEDRLVDSLTSLAKILAFGIPPVAAILAYIILGGWLISFVMNLIRHKGFTVVRKEDVLDISTGIFVPRRYSIAVRRVNLIELRQSLTTKLFGFYSVFIHSSGYGKQKNELSVLIPAADEFEAHRNLKMLLPEIPVGHKQVKPRLRTLSRFLIPPLGFILGLFVFFFLCYWLFEAFREIFLFVGIMAELPALWWLLLKIVSFFHTGIGKKGDVYTLSYTYAFAIFTIAVPARRISKVMFRQSLFQKMADCCDVIVYSYAEGKKRMVVPNINTQDAHEMFGTDIGRMAKKPPKKRNK